MAMALLLLGPVAADDLTVPDGALARKRGADSTVDDVQKQTGATEPSMAAIAMQSQEAARARAGLLPVALLLLVVAAALQASTNQSTMHWVLTSALLLTGAYAGVLAAISPGASEVDRRTMLPLGLMMAALCMTAIAHVGTLSPVVAVPFALVFSAGLGGSRAEAWLVYSICAVGYVVLAALSLSGVLSVTESVMPYGKDPTRALLAFPIVYEALLAVTFWVSRSSRRATVRAMERLEQANRQIRQRDALLVEAQADFGRVVDAGKVGRFTGTNVGPYVAGEVIGRGGMGEVYRARENESSPPVALKILHAHLQQEPRQVQRFLRESEVSGSLDSPHIVRVHGSGTMPDGSPYLAMELLEGEDLAEILRARTRLDPAETVTLVEQVARGLVVAKGAEIVHRDLKPQNLFFAGEESAATWKILDFGVSKIEQTVTMTQRGAVVGTPSYMSPEQAGGEAVDHRSDIFALGVIAYRALTGQPAFTASDATLSIYNVMYVQPARPTELAKVDEDVDLVLAIALAKDREHRFRSATTFASAFHDAARGELDGPFRDAGRQILEEHPWGTDRNVPRRT